MGGVEKREVESPYVPAPPSKPTIQELRELMETASREPTMPVVRPSIYRDDYVRVITERQWETLQAHKKRARERGYVIDEYSQ